MVVTYVSHKDAAKAIEGFKTAKWVAEYQKKNVSLDLCYLHTK